MAEITLSCPNVNGGTAVTIHAVSVDYAWKNLTNVTPVPQLYDITCVDFSGWENPLITVQGMFNVDDLDTNQIRHAHLLSFSKVRWDGTTANTITLTVPTGIGATQYNLLASDGSTTTLKVVVESFNINLNVQAGGEMGHIWNFTLVLRETAT